MMDNSSAPGLRPEPAYHKSWAHYIAKWITAYGKHGIPIWGITVQNEPEYAAPWEACVFTPEQERDFIRDSLGPILLMEHPNVKIIIYDHNKDHIVQWANTIFSDPVAASFVWGIGFHWYSGDGFDAVAAVHKQWPHMHLLPTEACNCPGVILEDWARAEAYAHDIIGDLNSGAEGWTDWNIVLDHTGGPNHLGNNCDAPIIANTATQELHYQPSYYAIGHFARFLARGSRRVAVHVTGNPNMELTAFVTPAGAHILIAINRWWQESQFTLTLTPTASDSTGHTHESPDEEGVPRAQRFARVVMPPHSFTTLVF